MRVNDFIKTKCVHVHETLKSSISLNEHVLPKKKNPTRSSHGLKGADADAFEAELNNKKIQKSVHGFISHFFFVDWVCPS